MREDRLERDLIGNFILQPESQRWKEQEIIFEGVLVYFLQYLLLLVFTSPSDRGRVDLEKEIFYSIET